jgi:hypothetical protein
MQRRITMPIASLLALSVVVVAFAPSSYAQPTRGKARTTSAQARTTSADAAPAAATRKCSTSGFKSAKEYNSSSHPWYTYSTCMTDHGLSP